MAQRSSNAGCFILAVVVGALALGVAVFVAYFMLSAKRVEMVGAEAEIAYAHGMAETVAAGSGEYLVFERAERPTLSVPAAGEPVTLEMFTAYKIDDTATDLAKDGFRQVADKAQVSWRMELNEVSDRNGELRGEFQVPWKIRHGGGSFSSAFRVDVIFDEAARGGLMKLRRGQWVEVEGQLLMEDGSTKVVDAVLVEKP